MEKGKTGILWNWYFKVWLFVFQSWTKIHFLEQFMFNEKFSGL